MLTGADVSARHRLPSTSLLRVARALELMGPMLEFEDLIAGACTAAQRTASRGGLGPGLGPGL